MAHAAATTTVPTKTAKKATVRVVNTRKATTKKCCHFCRLRNQNDQRATAKKKTHTHSFVARGRSCPLGITIHDICFIIIIHADMISTYSEIKFTSILLLLLLHLLMNRQRIFFCRMQCSNMSQDRFELEISAGMRKPYRIDPFATYVRPRIDYKPLTRSSILSVATVYSQSHPVCMSRVLFAFTTVPPNNWNYQTKIHSLNTYASVKIWLAKVLLLPLRNRHSVHCTNRTYGQIYWFTRTIAFYFRK